MDDVMTGPEKKGDMKWLEIHGIQWDLSWFNGIL